MYKPASAKFFVYDFACLIWILPFLRHLLWIGTIPIFLHFLPAWTMAVDSQYIILRSLRVMLYTQKWTNFAEKWPGKNEFFLCELRFAVRPHKELCWHSFKVACHAVGTEQWRARSIWNHHQAPPSPLYNVLYKDSQSLHFNRAVLMRVFSSLFHLLLPLFTSLMSSFPFYCLSTLSGFLPR